MFVYSPGRAFGAADHVAARQEQRVHGAVHAHAARQRAAAAQRPRSGLQTDGSLQQYSE